MPTRTRWLVLIIIGGLLVSMAVLDRDAGPDGRRSFGHQRVSPMPVADRTDVLASTWYCAAGTAVDGGAANLTVVIANAEETEVRGSLTWYPVDAKPVVTPLDIPASGVLSLSAVDSVTSPVVSAVVDVRGGGIAVEHVVSGERGASVAPCASDASPTWYFANGTTERDAAEVLSLFNPFPDDAIVDITFATDEGKDEPGALAGLPVPAGTTTLVDVHDHVRRRAVVATSVVARSGRVVVDRVQSFNGDLGRRGVALSLGAPEPAAEWTFPEGLSAEGVTEQWHVFNPTDREAEVSLELVPDEGEPVEPIDLTVPAGTQLVIDASDKVAAGVPHTSTIVSLNGVLVVAERSVDARPPSKRSGWSSSFGSPLAAARWLFPLGEVSGNTDEWIVVHNPNPEAVTLSVTALAGGQVLEIEGLQDVEVAPGGRVALRLGDHIQRSPLPVLVSADGDVVVERDLYRVGSVGITSSVGIPLP